MLLPKEISPNPLISATVEIRFKTGVILESLLNEVYTVFFEEFPHFEDALTFKNITEITVSDPDYAYEYIFKNDKYSVSVGDNIISFENINGYHFWDNYSSVIRNVFSKFNEKVDISFIERIGVRYVSLLENIETISDALNYSYDFSIGDLVPQRSFVRLNYRKDNIRLTVQVGQQIGIEKDNIRKRGLLIDIEAFMVFSEKESKMTEAEVFANIDKLHDAEKNAFFSLINEKYLTTSLNPIY